MFKEKKTQLFQPPGKVSTPPGVSNEFIKVGLKQSAQTTSLGNRALKYVTTGHDFVDQFDKCTAYKEPRKYDEVAADMQLLWSQNPEMTVRLTMYLRMITRQVQLPDGSKTEQTQRGQGLKHEGIFRMIWMAINHPDAFWKNAHLFIAAGGWKDIITMLSYDLVYNGWKDRKLDWDNFGQLLLAGLENTNTSELVKKYLPQIKANSNCKTVESQADNMIGKWICSLLFGNKEGSNVQSTYKKYRRLKSSGTAHQWQQLISQRKMLSINFDSIHGRALSLLVSSKFLKNQGLEEKYSKWIESKPVAKYTGYPYELLGPLKPTDNIGLPSSLTPYQKDTTDKQFLNLVEVAKKGMKPDDTGLLVVVDSSASMTSKVPGTKYTAYSVAISMALYFSYLMKGKFEGTWAEFSNTCHMNAWKGTTPTDRLCNVGRGITAGTNFQSVGDMFGEIKKKGVPESDFPSGIVCISDGCFNYAGTNKTNHKELLSRLRGYGFSKEYVDNFKVILWDVPNNHYAPGGHQAFEDFADCPNLYHISGLDPAAVAFITGVEGKVTNPKNSEELFEAAMDQELLNMIVV